MADSSSTTRSHFNAARLRSHTWDQLKLAASALNEGRGDASEVEALLKDLQTIELYWAYPGKDTVKRLQQMLKGREYHTLTQSANHVVRNLSSGAFRSDPGGTGRSLRTAACSAGERDRSVAPQLLRDALRGRAERWRRAR